MEPIRAAAAASRSPPSRSTRPDPSTLANTVSGGGGFTKNGAGDLQIDSTNTYSGPTNILAGSITTFSAGDNAIGGQSDVTIASGAVLARSPPPSRRLPGQTFTVNGARPARNSALLDLGIEASFDNGLAAKLSFNGEFSRNVSSFGASARLCYRS